jgi:hypothetical protein
MPQGHGLPSVNKQLASAVRLHCTGDLQPLAELADCRQLSIWLYVQDGFKIASASHDGVDRSFGGDRQCLQCCLTGLLRLAELGKRGGEIEAGQRSVGGPSTRPGGSVVQADRLPGMNDGTLAASTEKTLSGGLVTWSLYVGVAVTSLPGRPGFHRVRTPQVDHHQVAAIIRTTAGLRADPAELLAEHASELRIVPGMRASGEVA